MLPTIKLGSTDVSRLIMGGNIISGTSHISPELDMEMQRFYTMPRVQEAFDNCQQNGINTVVLRIDAHIVRALMEHRENGGKLHWIAQTAPEFRSLEHNLRMAGKIGPMAVYYHGGVVDNLYKSGDIQGIKDGLKTLKILGVPVGLCTHMPEVLLRAEEEEWGADWYMACVYNLTRPEPEQKQATCCGEKDHFLEEDRVPMFDAIRKVKKPCMAFKILGATRRCKTDQDREAAITEAYTSIKPTDGCVVGFFQKYSDQITQNAEFVRKLLSSRRIPATPVLRSNRPPGQWT